ncbi:metal-dependent transcriptional regulator [Polaribacter sp. MSW13]|uniref:Metal-dependent transcriptional regulator n=1 Tax=Polaribacter marinus TaxID=2916838 RepID=A0A9X1VMC7_9FLAO|nr:metal-dependent transcriptional regulator [Polaribacter marinus]MCI2228648.1 metal-dependent transcriptional regulator [Polaribacter marinus]
MNPYNPIIALLVFFGVVLVLFLIFKPKNGLFFKYQKVRKENEKTAIEDILKLLYHDANISKSTIFNELDFSQNLLLESIETMMDSGLIKKEKELFSLTKDGHEYALRIIRAHRLWEKYLSEKTGFHKEEWHKRAELKEHELSGEEVDDLSTLLGNPRYDPHGDPIPTKAGKIHEKKGILLSDLPVFNFGKIIHIEDEPIAVYKQILEKNIHLDSQVYMKETSKNRLVFESEGEQFILSPIVANNITVISLDKADVVEKDTMRLSNLESNQKAIIIGISKECRGENRRRLLDLGFVKGATVSIDLLNPLGDPKAFLIKGTAIALRKDQAVKILITKR